MRIHALLLPLLLLGCPAPETAPETGTATGGGGETATAEAPVADPAATGDPATAGDPAAEAAAVGVAEGAPLPDSAGIPQVEATPSTGEPGAGQVALSGTLSYEGSKEGQLRIEFLQVSDGGPPTMVHYEPIAALGEWVAFAPVNAGEIRVVAFLDQAGDGASSDDPGAAWPEPVEVGSDPITGIDLVLSDTPDLGDLAPKDHMDAGTPPPGDGAAPDAAVEGAAKDTP